MKADDSERTTPGITEHPWRFFFPLGCFGLLMGISGWWSEVPAPFVLWHPELMIGGFLLPVATGFLLYTLPRFFSAQRASATEAWILFAAEAAHLSAILLALPVAVAALKVVTLATFAVYALRRFPRGRPAPYFGFFILTGIILGLAGALAKAVALTALRYPQWWSSFASSDLALAAESFYRASFYHVFFWLLLAGMGTRLFPMLTLSLRSKQEPAWLQRLAFYRPAWLIAISAIVVSFVMSGSMAHPAFLWLRAFAFLFVAWQGWLLFRPATRRGITSHFTKLSNYAVVLGHFLVAFFPMYERSLYHLALAGGLGLGTIIVITRVLLAHEGADLAHELNSYPLGIAFGAMLIGAVVRALAIFPETYLFQLRAASGLWLFGSLVWILAILTYVIRDNLRSSRSLR